MKNENINNKSNKKKLQNISEQDIISIGSETEQDLQNINSKIENDIGIID